MDIKSIIRGVCTCLAVVSINANAAIVDVNKLHIDSMTVSVSTILGFNQTETVIFSQPSVWNLGVYQGVITNFNAGTINLLVESTSAYGALPGSGEVDTTLGTIDLNLSDLHMTATGSLTGDFNLWNATTSAIDSNSYDDISGEFIYGWSDTATLGLTGTIFTGPVDYSIQLVGKASVVPVPPSIWLFGSGLLGLIGVARRKKSWLYKR